MEAKDEQENKPGSEGRSNQENCPCLRHWSTGLKWELLSSRTQFLRRKCNKTNKSPLLSFCRLLKSNLLVSFNHVARYLSNASFSHFVLISSSNSSLIQFLVHFWGLKRLLIVVYAVTINLFSVLPSLNSLMKVLHS